MGVAGQRVADEDDVIAGGGERSPCLVGQCHWRDDCAVAQGKLRQRDRPRIGAQRWPNRRVFNVGHRAISANRAAPHRCVMAGGQQKTSPDRGERLSRYHPVSASASRRQPHGSPSRVSAGSAARAAGSPEASNGASSGALYCGGRDALAGSMRCSEGHACLGKTTPNFQRLRLSVVVSTPQTPLVLARGGAPAGKRHRPLREDEEGGNRRGDTQFFHPSHLAEPVFRRSLHPSLRRCRWVARRRRAVFPQPLLMRANAIYSIVGQIVSNE